MLSRVAAVKAPRTHNRRRVTGSSGGRREGRESEPQRPNMFRHHFHSVVLLLFVVMMCGSCTAGVVPEVPSQGTSSGKYYVWRDVKDGEEKVSSLRVPSLLKVGSDVFAVAEAHCTKGEGLTGIASELLALTDEQAKELATTELKTQVLEECPSDDKKVSCSIANQAGSHGVKNLHVSRPTTVVKGSDIYMLAGSYSWTLTAVGQEADWGLMLVKGNVSKKEGEKNERILWNDTYVIPWYYKGNQGSLKRLVGSGGSGVKMEDGTFVFPLEGTKKAKKDDGNEKDGKAVSLIIYSKDAKSWKLPKGMSADGCSDPSVVEWEKDKLMMMTACDDGRRRVYESGDKGDSWTEALGTLSRVWSNKHKRHEKGVGSGFITATIDGADNDKRTVMLVTLPVYSSKGGKEKEKGVLHLWLTDNTHIVDIGPVSGEEGDDVAASSLLYKSGESRNDNNGEKLIALYEKKKSGDEESSYGMASVRLTAQLEKVKEVLKTWKEVDERVSQLCTTLLAQKITLTDNACSADIKITDGLVGFLSGNFSDKTWRDEYLGVDATVNNDGGATNTSGGVTFRGAWAEWPVGSQGQNQLYHFANYNFTLVATVSIDGVPKEDTPIPLLGVRLDGEGEKKLMELSYDREKKWRVLCSDGKIKKLKSTWEPQTQHQLAIVLQNGSQGSAYVDGQRVCEDVQRKLDNTDSKEISHFYIGGDGDKTRKQEDVSVTVTNVLLYNRPLTFPGTRAEVEADADSPSADQESSAEPASPFVARNQNAATSAGELPDAPVEQTASQQPPQKSETQKNATIVGKSATTQEVPATTLQGSVAKAAASNSHAAGEATGDGSTDCESGLLPSLLLLGLWGFAAL
ncbi:putative trans-sialidase, Group V [Trypanosoma cruzi]|uniref:Putative trans-sialidase, Group V n=1 Tax=Trypanosoma cruzi TaxID=5693 RepID=A0A2V2UME8_TRYCR|nr:putative trans-sialidase, Group V [Trypanosoma cruzi]PWV08767.1 putative trans-sialidase, Group V [Trypanosoma cruzi]RNC36891.1 c71 surface protein [Trypanosoma cruzi]